MRVVFTLHLICLLFHTSLSAVDKSGPCKITLTRASPCQKPTLPLDENPMILFYAEVYNTTKKANLMRGNVTVVRDTRNKRIKVKGYHWEDERWNIHYIMNNMGCHSVILPVVTTFLGVKYDKKTCNFFKGNYTFSDFDTNKIQHTLMMKQEYGRTKWVYEVFSQAGSVLCWEFETVVEPAI